MDLMSYLSDDEWQAATEPINMDGFAEYHIIHRIAEGGGKFTYSAVHIKDEIPIDLQITGASAKRDPLKEIQLVKLRVDGSIITGIDDNGDCVVRKS